jgi:MFS superfamily sulfate permease-like transporter
MLKDQQDVETPHSKHTEQSGLGVSEDQEGFRDRARNFSRTIISDWKTDLKQWPKNLNAALSNVAITAPLIVSRIAFINKWVPESEKLSPGVTLWAMLICYSMSFAIHGGGLIFKTFTTMQAFVLIVQIENYGVSSMPMTVIGTGLVILFAVATKLYDIMKFMPNCVLVGFQMSVGITYIMNELIGIMGIPNSARMGVNLGAVISFFWKNASEINFIIPGVVLTGSVLFHYLVVRFPKIPWHSMLFIASIPIAYVWREFFKSFPKGTLMYMSWPRDPNFPSHILSTEQKTAMKGIFKLSVLAQSEFILSVFTLGLMTLMESGMIMEGLRNWNNIAVKKSRELLGLGITNIICGLLGLPPCSLSMCRTMLMHQLGANSPVYNLLGAIFLVLFLWVLFPLTVYVPMITISFFNISIGLLLIDLDTIWFYWRYNRRFALVALAMILASFVLHIIFGLLITWLVFFGVYLSRIPNESFRIAIYRDIKERILQFAHESSSKYADDENSVNLLKGGSRLNQILSEIEKNGIVYQLHGRFNFAYFTSHVENILQLKKEVVLIDMSEIFWYDIEFMSKYRDMFEALSLTRSRIYVTGIPKAMVGDNQLWRNTWIENMDEQERILYTY